MNPIRGSRCVGSGVAVCAVTPQENALVQYQRNCLYLTPPGLTGVKSPGQSSYERGGEHAVNALA